MPKKHTRTVKLGNTTHTYVLRRSRRARSLLLHVNLDGSIELVVPWHASFSHAEAFLREKEQWLFQALERQSSIREKLPQRTYTSGETVLLFGEPFVLDIDIDSERKRQRVVTQEGLIKVYAEGQEHVRMLLKEWYIKESKTYLVGQAILYAKKLGVGVASIKVRDTKSQWGSCHKGKKALTFSWRLALAPLSVAHYVIAHEVAHLVHANHSKQFWNTVAQLEPSYIEQKKWLKRNGHTLTL